MLPVGGTPLLTRQIAILRDALGIGEIYLIVGHRANDVRRAYGDGSSLGVHLQYVREPGARRRPRDRAARLEPHVASRSSSCSATSSTSRATTPSSPRRTGRSSPSARSTPRKTSRSSASNYCRRAPAELDRRPVREARGGDDAVRRLRDLPLHAGDLPLCVRETQSSPRTGRLELTDIIDRAARETGQVRAFLLRGSYLNVNTVQDLNLANYLCRANNFARKRVRVSVIIPADNEAASIGGVIRDFRDHVDEIIVMDNESRDGTAEIARELGATVHSPPARLRRRPSKQGMDVASGDILVLVEADGTFRRQRPRKVPRVPEGRRHGDRHAHHASDDRAGRQHGRLLRWGNVVVGQDRRSAVVEFEPRFTDVGCTYRAIWRDDLRANPPHV